MLQAFGLRLGGLEAAQLSNSVERMFDRVRTPAWGYSSSGNYGFNSYARTELTLRTLEALVGPQTLARAMRTYHERFRFAHPSSDDFYAVVSEVAGRDMSGFFAQTTERPGHRRLRGVAGEERAGARAARRLRRGRRPHERHEEAGAREGAARPTRRAGGPGARPSWCGAAAR